MTTRSNPMTDHKIATTAGHAPVPDMDVESTRSYPPEQPAVVVSKLTERQAVVLTAFTGIMLCPMHLLQEAVDRELDRVTYTHQYGTPELWATIKSAFREEALAMLPDGFVR